MKFTAQLFDHNASNETGREWLSFDDCRELLVANEPGEVESMLAAVESHARAGRYAVGYVSYEAAPAFDDSLPSGHKHRGLPLAAFGIFDEAKNASLATPSTLPVELHPNTSRTDFDKAIAAIKRYLEAGDTYQVNYTHRLHGNFSASAEAVFARLYRAQPSEYAAMLRLGEQVICSLSPELFFKREGSRLTTEPMKGTRPRGRSCAEDEALKKDLETSLKDQAENLMIVDMIRNDLGRVATAGSVKADRLFQVRQLPTVWQMVSNVSAESQASLADIFGALFPCASVTGAPRRRTMQIISELEESPRGVYTGAVGIVKPGGDCRFSVGIRTLVLDSERQTATYGVGGGIVWDSDPESEWQESLIKGEILRHESPDFDLLETLRFDPADGIYLLAEHLQRLKSSAIYFGFVFDEAEIRARLADMGGDVALRLRLLLSRTGSIQVEQVPLPGLQDSVRLKLASRPVDSSNVFLFHKTTHRKAYEDAKAGIDDCDDVILWNERSELTETTICNLFLEINGELLTPAQSSGLLAGTYREQLLRSGKAKEAVLVKADLDRAERIFVANSVRQLVPAELV